MEEKKIRHLTEVSKEEFEKFLSEYPNELVKDYFMDAVSYNDFTLGDWPNSTVAMYKPPMYNETETVYRIWKGEWLYYDT